uniref:Uncharacterized protein n=1 Tax=Anguilla anguilla TaxID=7936 RepID=A0A0E9RG84_ANGAN
MIQIFINPLLISLLLSFCPIFSMFLKLNGTCYFKISTCLLDILPLPIRGGLK